MRGATGGVAAMVTVAPEAAAAVGVATPTLSVIGAGLGGEAATGGLGGFPAPFSAPEATAMEEMDLVMAPPIVLGSKPLTLRFFRSKVAVPITLPLILGRRLVSPGMEKKKIH